MALSQFTVFVVVNQSGQTVTYSAGGRFNLKVTGWFIDPSTGKITYAQLSDDDLSFTTGTLVNGAELQSSEIDNATTTKYLGYQVQLEVTHDAGGLADGTFDIYMDGGDATGELMTDATGYADAEASGLTHIGSLTWESNGQDDEVMRSEVFNV